MSRYTRVVKSTIDEKNYKVMTGWDNPLRYIFLDIEHVGNKKDEFDYDSLDEKDIFSRRDLSSYNGILEKFGLELPEELINLVNSDRDEYYRKMKE